MGLFATGPLVVGRVGIEVEIGDRSENQASSSWMWASLIGSFTSKGIGASAD